MADQRNVISFDIDDSQLKATRQSLRALNDEFSKLARSASNLFVNFNRGFSKFATGLNQLGLATRGVGAGATVSGLPASVDTGVGSPPPPKVVTTRAFRYVSPAWGNVGVTAAQAFTGNLPAAGLTAITAGVGAAAQRLGAVRGLGPITNVGVAGIGTLLGAGMQHYASAIQEAANLERARLFAQTVGGIPPGGAGAQYGMPAAEWIPQAAAMRRAVAPMLRGTGGTVGFRADYGAAFPLATAVAPENYVQKALSQAGDLRNVTESLQREILNMGFQLKRTEEETAARLRKANREFAYSYTAGGRQFAYTPRISRETPESQIMRWAVATGAQPGEVARVVAGFNYPQTPFFFREAVRRGERPRIEDYTMPGFDALRSRAITAGGGGLWTGMGIAEALVTGGRDFQGMRDRAEVGPFGFNTAQYWDVLRAVTGFQRNISRMGPASEPTLQKAAWNYAYLHARWGMDPNDAARSMMGMFSPNFQFGGGMAGQFAGMRAAGYRTGMHPWLAEVAISDPSQRLPILQRAYREQMGLFGRTYQGAANLYEILGIARNFGWTKAEFHKQFFTPGSRPGGLSSFEELLFTTEGQEKMQEIMTRRSEAFRSGLDDIRGQPGTEITGAIAELRNTLAEQGGELAPIFTDMMKYQKIATEVLTRMEKEVFTKLLKVMELIEVLLRRLLDFFKLKPTSTSAAPGTRKEKGA